jgi:hypothetical protein
MFMKNAFSTPAEFKPKEWRRITESQGKDKSRKP